MGTAEVAAQLAALCSEGEFLKAVDTLYSEDVVSIEASDFQGSGRELRGKQAVRAKNVAWFTGNDVHKANASGPFVSPEHFAMVFDFDWTSRSTGQRVRMSEVAIYTVAQGRIVREEFLYGAMR